MTSAVEDYFGVGVNEEESVEEESYQLEDRNQRIDEDEAEVAKLAGAKTLGLGSWVDGFMNWVLFDDVEEERLRREKSKLKEAKPYLGASSSQTPGRQTVSKADTEVERADTGTGGMLKDVAWLLGAASKIIF